MTAMVLSFAGLSGSKVVFVFEQRDGFARGLQRQLAVRFAADDRARLRPGSTYGSSNKPILNFQNSIGATSSSSCDSFKTPLRTSSTRCK